MSAEFQLLLKTCTERKKLCSISDRVKSAEFKLLLKTCTERKKPCSISDRVKSAEFQLLLKTCTERSCVVYPTGLCQPSLSCY